MLSRKNVLFLSAALLPAGLALTPGARSASPTVAPIDNDEITRLERRLTELRRGGAIRRRIYPAEEANDHVIKEEWGSLNWIGGRKVGNAEGVTLGHVFIEPGKSNPRHAHPTCEELLFVLQGTILQTWGNEQVVLHTGDTIWVDRGVFHNAKNIGKERAELIVTYDSAQRDIVHESDYRKTPERFPTLGRAAAVALGLPPGRGQHQ